VSLADPPTVLAVSSTAAPLVDPLFISDLHLAAERPHTIARFLQFLADDAPRHRELVVLGDLFEFWIGDDAAASARPVVEALAAHSARGGRLLLMNGNRDPLLGHAFAVATGGTLLADPIVVEVAGTATLLSHGDAWCTLDVAYQRFRAMVRQPEFQQDFLSKTLDERIAFAASFAVLIVLQIGLGILGSFVTAAFSRHREFHADKGGAELAGRENMIAALRRLMTTRQLVDPSHPALANFKIAGGRSWMHLLASHPPLEERIAALEAGR
jgi:UDP-2,3-diacylglucosamine pyrophosphatase LpxH